jgi:hypothetical protein
MPAPGYDVHHIVERNRDHFTREAIEGADNLVRVPQMKHWEINAGIRRRIRSLVVFLHVTIWMAGIGRCNARWASVR